MRCAAGDVEIVIKLLFINNNNNNNNNNNKTTAKSTTNTQEERYASTLKTKLKAFRESTIMS
jgi:hypothetical protein